MRNLCCAIGFLLAACSPTEESGSSTNVEGSQASHARKNVLFIVVDDLRPELACYGAQRALSPHIDALASRGVRFERAYCQQALCNPSRASALTGCRPDTTHVIGLDQPFREALPDVVTLPQHFKQNGYRAISIGKIFHGKLLDPQSWSEPEYSPGRNAVYATPRANSPGGSNRKGPSIESAEVPDNAYRDGQVADRAVEVLRNVGSEPFFLAVGFHKPHLPFAAPKRYWDLYGRERIELAPNPSPPENAPSFATHNWFELRQHRGIPPEGPLSQSMARELIHGYLACVSYIDAQVGRVIDELERLELSDQTLVVLWGDHGFHLGEHGLWAKKGLFEDALRVPLIIRAPGARAGTTCHGIVELVDLYPTLCELAGLSLPAHLEGTSFAPLLSEPDRPWKPAAFSHSPAAPGIRGYSMRTERWRFTSWRRVSDQSVLEQELYDHDADPHENVNLANEAHTAATLSALSSQLDEGWQAAVPR